ncbi:MAG: hypothetical protein ACKVP7_08370 [Hyphomicrobiaceae bacterium]
MNASVPCVGTTVPEFWELAERAAAIRTRFEACRTEISGKGSAPDAVAQSISAHLASLTTTALPPAAQVIWQERIIRPLKADGAKPLTPRAIAAICSWPSARVGGLIDALSEIETILVDAENEARNEIIYAEISRAYS